MQRKLCLIGLTCLIGFSFMTYIADAEEPIAGPWLWMIVPTDAGIGGQASTDVDSLDEASKGKVTEEKVAKNGAKEGDEVGDYEWTPGELPANGDINVCVVDIKMTKVADFNDVTSYGLLILESSKKQAGVTMGTSSDDSIKVWLNGEEVHKMAVNRGRGGTPANINGYQDRFEVDLKKGANLLMVKVSERGGGWGQYVGVDADVEHNIDFDGFQPVEPAGKLATQWAQIKNAH
ncbi:hypothetical protein J5I95_08790 [Candidatus Poribacteria bacterium]|nr:hypothetical protein [Candidatus Poribacteria bacterium]